MATRPSLSERLQAASFVGTPLPEGDDSSLYQSRVTVAELEMLAARFVGRTRMRQTFRTFGEQRGETLLPQQQASAALIRHTERVLAGVFGASSAKLVLTSALQGRNMQLEEIATIVDEASELFDFSRGLLQGAIEHISQGISVVDKQLRLVAWNQRYVELFNFPPDLIQVAGRLRMWCATTRSLACVAPAISMSMCKNGSLICAEARRTPHPVFILTDG